MLGILFIIKILENFEEIIMSIFFKINDKKCLVILFCIVIVLGLGYLVNILV